MNTIERLARLSLVTTKWQECGFTSDLLMDKNPPVDNLDTGSTSGEVCYCGLSVPCLWTTEGRITLQFLEEKSSGDEDKQVQNMLKSCQK